MLKKLVAGLLMVPTLTYAAGPIDGIYFCNVSVSGQTTTLYVTVNGQPDGRTIYAVAAVQEFTPLYGYGIGQVVGNVFSGNTNFGLPFNTSVDGASITGTVTLALDVGPVPSAVSCIKVW